jgi:CHAD domain-containing protein
MAFQLRQDESIRRGLRRLCRKELDAAAHALEWPRDDRSASLHDARTSVKKARAILKIIDPWSPSGTRQERRRLQKVGRTLSPFRDADASIEIFDRLRERTPDWLPEHASECLRSALLEDRDRLWNSEPRLPKCVRALRKTRTFMKKWSTTVKFAEVGLALADSRRAGRRALERARPGGAAADFHRWRIEAKTHWYQLRLLEGAGGEIPETVSRLEDLETWLGEDHNAVILCARLFGDQALMRVCGDLRALRQASDRYQKELRERSLALGAQLYTGDDAGYLARVQGAWESWRRVSLDRRRAA